MYHSIITWLNSGAFKIFSEQTTWAELLGFVSGLATVWLVAKTSIWTFPIGIANAIFFLVLFWDAKLFADASLQIFFIVIQVLGWWAWLRAGPNRTPLEVAKTTPRALIVAGVMLVGGYFIMHPILVNAGDVYPTLDALTTALSISAQGLLTWKFIENWYLWIAADLIYVPLYAAKGLWFTSILYVGFLFICFYGVAFWLRVKRGQDNGTGPNSAYSIEQLGDSVASEPQTRTA